MRLFLRNSSLRESCYECRIKEKGSLADITMGDYWGVDAVHPEIDSHDGVSLVILHTEKGYTTDIISSFKIHFNYLY